MPDKQFRERVLEFGREVERAKLKDPKWRDILKLLTNTSYATLLPAHPAVDRLGLACGRKQKIFVLSGDGRTDESGVRKIGLRDRLCGAREREDWSYNTYMVGEPVVTVTAAGSRPVIMTAAWEMSYAQNLSWDYAEEDGLLFDVPPNETLSPVVDEILLSIHSFGPGGGAEAQAEFSWMAVVPAMRLNFMGG
jgi:hypothetical protein